MRCWIVFNVLFLNLYLTEWATGQTIYNAGSFYKPMTDDYDVRQRGSLFLPPCVKNLMNCWEVIRPDLVCKFRQYYRVALESMCMDLRMNCREFTGPLPFSSLDVSIWNYCTYNINQHYSLNLDPDTRGINNWNNWS